MNKVLIVIAFLIVPFLATAQNDSEKVKVEINTTINTEIALKKVEKISIDPKTQYLDLNYKKSNDIINVKTYIRSLRLKGKTNVKC